MSIFEKMLAIQAEMPVVKKNLSVITNQEKNYGYKAVSEKDVKEAVKPLEKKYGIYSYPAATEREESGIYEDAKGRKLIWIRSKVTFRFVNVDTPSEYIEITAFGDGIDTGDKAPGKADTYACKYCLMKAYKISTGAEDGNDNKGKKNNQENSQNSTVTKMATKNQVYKINKDWGPAVQQILDYYKVKSLEELTMQQASDIISKGALE